MANTFTLTSSSSRDGRHMVLYCSQTKDIPSNTSTIYWTLSTTGGSSNYYSTGPTKVIINGATVYSSSRKEWSSKTFPAAKGSISGNVPVVHTQYGESTIEVTLSTAIYSGTVVTDKATWTLDSIERASQPSCITWPETTSDVGFLGDTIVVHMNRASSDFKHYAHVDFGSFHEDLGGPYDSNFTWTIPISYGSAISGGMTGWGTITVQTYSKSTGSYIGQKTVDFMVHVPEYTLSQAPTTMSLNNTNPTIATWNVAIKGFTKVNWSSTTPTSQYGNVISKYYLCLIENKDNFDYGDSLCDLQSSTSNSGTTNIITYTPGTYRVKMSIIDNRGKWSHYILPNPNNPSTPLKLTIYDYSAPMFVTANAFRCDVNGTKSSNGRYLFLQCQGSVGASIGGRNNISVYYQTRHVEDTWSQKTEFPVGGTTILSNIDLGQSYEVRLIVKDLIGTESVTNISIPVGKTDFNLTPTGAGFGRYHDPAAVNMIQSDWDLEIRGDELIDFIVEHHLLDLPGSNNALYITKYRNGRCEVYGTIVAEFSTTNYLVGQVELTNKFLEVHCATCGMKTYDMSAFDRSTQAKIGTESYTNDDGELVYIIMVVVESNTGGFTSQNSRSISVRITGSWN